MFDSDYDLNQDTLPQDNCIWGNVTLCDDVFKELSNLQCEEHENHLQQFFPDINILSEPLSDLWYETSKSARKRNIQEYEETEEKLEPEVIISNKNKVINENKTTNDQDMEISICSQIIDGSSTAGAAKSTAVDLVCSLDKEIATNEQVTSVPDHQLEFILSKLSDTGLCHICTLVCSMSSSDQSRLGSLLCRHLLVPRLEDNDREPCSRAVTKTLIQFTKHFPHLTCSEVLLPLLLKSPAKHEENTMLQIVTEALGPQYHEYLLKAFLENEPSKLNEWQVLLIQELQSPICSDFTKQHLVQLLEASANDMCRNTRFGKLLISVIQQLGPTASTDIREKLAAIVTSNKSVLKRAAEKALRAL